MDIYNQYKSDPKVSIYKLIKGKKGFDTAIEMLFGDDVSGGKEYAARFSAQQKKSSIFFIYKRKLIKNYKIGVKLIVGSGENESVVGEEYPMEKIPASWPKNI
jgi:hypothetical protein